MNSALQVAEEIWNIYYANCREVTQLWNNIQQWVNNKLGINLVLTNLMKLHGYIITDQNFWPLNLILMITRKYIFWCTKKTLN